MDLDTFEKETTQGAHSDVLLMKQKIEQRRGKNKKIQKLVVALFVLVALFASLFAYSQYRLYRVRNDEKVGQMNPSQATQQEEGVPNRLPKTSEEVVAALGRHVIIPEGTPQIAEVQDVDKLKEKQAFFKDAKNGDIVIVFASTIYVYRPSVDRVVAQGDISGVGQTNP